MIIRHANFHRWSKWVQSDPFAYFGKSNTTRIRSTLKKVEECSIYHEIEPLNLDFFDWFKPMYEEQIGLKENAKIFDIVNTTLNNKDHSWPYYSLTLFENKKPIGATIFSVRNNLISIAYRIYQNDWPTAKLQASPSLYTEYLICEHAKELNLETISHGKDRNPYGINSAIGLAAFKLLIGCSPHLSKEFDISELDTEKLTKDALVLELPKGNNSSIVKAYLITSRENEQKYLQVTKYPEQLEVEVLYRD